MVENEGGANLDVLTYGLLNKKVEEAKNVSGEKITEAVNTYLDENPVAAGATSEQVKQIQDNTNKITELKDDITNRHNDIVVLLNEIKTLVQNGGTTEQIVALLDQAILDSAVLA